MSSADRPRRLILNADDLGISRAVNRAIARAAGEGMLTSASLMANMAALDDALENVVGRQPGLGVGLHLCLTSGRPVLPPAEVPLLIGRDGQFYRGFFGLMRLVWSRRRQEALTQIAQELEAQAARLDACGVAIDHLNGHQHVHMIPGIFAVAAGIARKRGAAVRVPVSAAKPQAAGGVVGGAKRMLLSALARKTEIRGADCLGVAESGRITRTVLQTLIAAVSEPVTEIFCHPGLPGEEDGSAVCSREDRAFIRSAGRTAELEALLDPSLREELAGRQIVPVRFRDVLPQLQSSGSAARAAA